MKLMMLVNKDEHVEVKKINLDEENDDYKEMFKWLEEILEDHPKSWKKYSDDTEECDKIINMEIQELVDAKENKKFHELEKEYIHCAAAFLYGYQMAKKQRETMEMKNINKL